MRPIDANALKATMIETLEQIKANPKMDGQEMHIIAGISPTHVGMNRADLSSITTWSDISPTHVGMNRIDRKCR